MSVCVISPTNVELGGVFLGFAEESIRVGFPVAESRFNLEGQGQDKALGFRIAATSLEQILALAPLKEHPARVNQPIAESSAVLSEDKLYRYELVRAWAKGARMLFVMLNPSTADASVDDPTIRRCIGFARRDGFAGVEVVNLFAYRTAYPKALREAAASGADVIGTMNDEAIRAAAARAARGGRVVIAWGGGVTFGYKSRITAFKNRDNAVLDILRSCGEVYRFLVSTVSTPVPHPLMLPSDARIDLLEGSLR